jgi:hypothetical protein
MVNRVRATLGESMNRLLLGGAAAAWPRAARAKL